MAYLADVLTAEQRRLNMRRIRGKDTKLEMTLRHGLHSRGLRYRLHQKNLSGKPDMVFPRHGAVIFVHGCFWHGHDCSLFKWPATRADFWREKIEGNRERDNRIVDQLMMAGWRVLVVWECALRGRFKIVLTDVLNESEFFVRHGKCQFSEVGEERRT